jgi:hypothetical protein
MPRDLMPVRGNLLKSVITTPSATVGIFFALCALVLTSLACQIDIGGPERPGEPILSDQAKTTEVSQAWSQAITDAVSSGQVIVLFDEAQITGYVMQRLETDPTPLLRNPQIYLRQGQIQVYGIFERGILKATALVRVEPSIDDAGELSLRLVEASVGPIPAPELLRESISAILTEALTGSIGSLATGIRLTSVAISDGEMSIVGEIR